MSREIKFRVWSRAFKKFTDGYENENRVSYDELYSDPPGLFFGGLRALQNDGDYVLQQYTGINDTKGREIYEGDIVYSELRFQDKAIYKNVSEVLYNNLRGAFFYYKAYLTHEAANEKYNNWIKAGDQIGNTGFIVSNSPEDHIEVIGNIFENPELVNE